MAASYPKYKEFIADIRPLLSSAFFQSTASTIGGRVQFGLDFRWESGLVVGQIKAQTNSLKFDFGYLSPEILWVWLLQDR
jgi:hypothetical protein